MQISGTLVRTILLASLTAAACGDSATPPSILVGPTAEGRAVELAGRSIDLVRLSGNAGSETPRSMIVGPADLDHGPTRGLLRASYRAGFPVAVAGARQGDTDKLREIVGHEPGVGLPDDAPVVDLASVHRPQCGDRTVFHTDLLSPPGLGGPAADNNDAQYIAQLLLDYERCPAPRPGTATATAQTAELATPAQANSNAHTSTPDADVLSLSHQYNYSNQLSVGDQSAQLSNSVNAARSFVNRYDVYYIQQSASFNSPDNGWQLESFPQPLFPEDGFTIDASPQSTAQNAVSTMSTSIEKKIGGTFGWDGDGPEATVNGGVSLTNTASVSVPNLRWVLGEDLTDMGAVGWTFDLGSSFNVGTIETSTGWAWTVPWDYYEAGATTFDVKFLVLNWSSKDLTWIGKPSVPFSTFELEAPVVASVSAGDKSTANGEKVTVKPGEEFVIHGSNLYVDPTNEGGYVIIGGKSIAGSNICFEDAQNQGQCSDTAITVIAPEKGTLNGGENSVVISNAEGFSNDGTTDTVTIDIKN